MHRPAAVSLRIDLASILVFLFASTLPMPALSQPFSFTFLRPSAPFVDYGDARMADINGDGRLDFLALGNSRKEPPFAPVSYQALTGAESRNDFSGVWQIAFDVTNLPVALWHGSVAWRDFDGDGDIDALMAGATNNAPPYVGATILLENNGGALAPAAATLPGLFGATASWADFDSDGDLDILLIGAESADVFRTILLANDGGSFAETPTNLPDMAYGDIAWADFDNDGDQDVLLSGALADGTFVTDVFRNTDGEFDAIGSDLPNPAFSSADWGDYDGDGDLDLVFSGGQLAPLIFDGLLQVYRNDDGVLTRVANLLPNFYGDARWGDYDSDGDPDIVVAGSRNAAGGKGVRILQNKGDGIFSELTYLTGVSFASVDFADYDGDLDPDILVSGLDREGALLGLYRNDVRIPNTAPSVPGGLTSTASGGVTTLSWEASTDEQSGSGSLTYNVRVGTTPGAGDVVSATTAGTTSRRLISANGNADQATSINLRLPNGSYHWTVQAIDASFAASSFATELPLNVTGKGTASGNEDGPGELMFALGAPYPNPSRGSVTLHYSLGRAESTDSRATVSVFDVRGSLVARETIKPGTREGDFVWNANESNAVAAGIYFIHLVAGSDRATSKVVIAR